MTAHPQHVVKNTLPSNRPFPDEIPFGPRDRYSYVDEAGVSIVSNGSYSEPAKSGFNHCMAQQPLSGKLPWHLTFAGIKEAKLLPPVLSRGWVIHEDKLFAILRSHFPDMVVMSDLPDNSFLPETSFEG